MREGIGYEQPVPEEELEILAKIARLRSREIELEANPNRTSQIALMNVVSDIRRLEAELRDFRYKRDNNIAA